MEERDLIIGIFLYMPSIISGIYQEKNCKFVIATFLQAFDAEIDDEESVLQRGIQHCAGSLPQA